MFYYIICFIGSSLLYVRYSKLLGSFRFLQAEHTAKSSQGSMRPCKNGGRRILADEPTDGRYAGNNLYKATSVADICKGTTRLSFFLKPSVQGGGKLREAYSDKVAQRQHLDDVRVKRDGELDDVPQPQKIEEAVESHTLHVG